MGYLNMIAKPLDFFGRSTHQNSQLVSRFYPPAERVHGSAVDHITTGVDRYQIFVVESEFLKLTFSLTVAHTQQEPIVFYIFDNELALVSSKGVGIGCCYFEVVLGVLYAFQ